MIKRRKFYLSRRREEVEEARKSRGSVWLGVQHQECDYRDSGAEEVTSDKHVELKSGRWLNSESTL